MISFFSDKDLPSKFLYLKQLTTWIAHSRMQDSHSGMDTRIASQVSSAKRDSDSFKTPYNMCDVFGIFMVLILFLVTQALSQACLNNMCLMWQVLMNLRQPDL